MEGLRDFGAADPPFTAKSLVRRSLVGAMPTSSASHESEKHYKGNHALCISMMHIVTRVVHNEE